MPSDNFFTEIYENQQKIGVHLYKRLQHGKVFFNQFINDIYRGHDKQVGELTDEELCQRIIANVAIVNIEITSPDAIVIERSVRGGLLQLVTQTGGLLSLYAGFSFLSLGEIVFLFARLTFWRVNVEV